MSAYILRSLVKDNAAVSIAKIKRRPLVHGEIRLKIALAGICRTDVLVANNKIPSPNKVVLGHEICGIVVDKYDGCSIPLNNHATIVPFRGCGHCKQCTNERYELCPESKMMGLDIDGAFADEIIVYESQIKLLPNNINMKLAAMVEPIAAVLAVKKAIKKKETGLILGNNRIATLTKRVLHVAGYDKVELESESEKKEGSYDFVVETDPSDTVLQRAASAVKVGGTIVLKSRSSTQVSLPLITLIEKEISLKAVRYASFEEAIELLPKLNVEDLFGPVFPLENFAEALSVSSSNESRKHYFLLGGEDVWNS